MDANLLKIESEAYTKKLLIQIKLDTLDKLRQDVLAKSKEAEFAMRMLDQLSMNTKTPYVQLTTKRQ